jgi:hypothetical protein
MMRVAIWEQALSDYISSKRDEPFQYGVNDCCMFAAGAVEAMTGVDPMEEFKGTYSDLRGSIKALKEIGDGDLETTLDSKFEEVAISHAQRGDLAFFDESVGVIMGGFAYFVSDEGLERIPREMWEKCWSVDFG